MYSLQNLHYMSIIKGSLWITPILYNCYEVVICNLADALLDFRVYLFIFLLKMNFPITQVILHEMSNTLSTNLIRSFASLQVVNTSKYDVIVRTFNF